VTDQSNLPALQRSLREIVCEYDEKVENAENVAARYAAFHREIDSASTIGATYVGRVYDYHPGIHASRIKDNLRKSAWKHAYHGLNIHRIAPADERKKFEMALENPPEFTLDNIGATFGDYIRSPREHILRSLAKCFADLDPAFKSHSKVQIGVKGLPKRVILPNCGSWGSYGYEKLKDLVNALRVYENREHVEHLQFEDWLKINKLRSPIQDWAPDQRYTSGSVVQYGGDIWIADPGSYNKLEFDPKNWRKYSPIDRGLTLKCFANGNAHLQFDRDRMLQINRALAEYYGDVLPDTPEENPKKRPSTELAKDLQFYPTPRKAIDEILSDISFEEGASVLEPSCGDGRIMDVIRENAPTADLLGVECDAQRASRARAKGHSVMLANFLETSPDPRFSYVIMNPPFYGLHWKQHLDHALKFLAPKGTLICILPAAAEADGHLEEYRGMWQDLPMGSFKESGTNICTGYLRIFRRHW